MYPELPVFLTALALFLPSADSDEFCSEKCLSDRIRIGSSKSIDAYLEYQKVVVKVEPNEIESIHPEPAFRRHSRDLIHQQNSKTFISGFN